MTYIVKNKLKIRCILFQLYQFLSKNIYLCKDNFLKIEMFNYRLVPTLVFLIFFCLSCNINRNRDDLQKLTNLDAVIDSVPRLVSDSLKQINVSDLSRENRAYYNLLRTISDDKSYVNFSNDSLITSVVDYYNNHKPNNNNYIRSLIYQGIVRTRMGVNDSTVFEPLKEANKIFNQEVTGDPEIGYMISYFLGNIHYNNRNHDLATNYFNDALKYAAVKKDSTHIFDTYLALYWNEMIEADNEKGKIYLDSVSSYFGKWIEKDYFILNAQSVYYNTQGDYTQSLDFEKKRIALANKQKEEVDLSRIYFNISNRYYNLNRVDSAMHYALNAIENIKDSTFRQNYLFYQNVAKIAEKQQDYKLANDYRAQAFKMYEQSIRNRLDTQVIELEKKYDLSEAENTLLRARQSTLLIITIALILLLSLVFVMLLNMRNRRKIKIRLLKAEHEAETHALKAALLMEEAGKRNWLIDLYGYVSDRLTSLQEQFGNLSQKYVSSQPKVYSAMEKILHETDTELHDIPTSIIPDNDTFFAYTGIKDDDAIFNANEKLMLMLLACKAGNKQIATFMNTSLESIRVRKSQLKKKMIEKGLNTALFS